MKPDRHGLFTELEPPTGGVERFRQRLDEAQPSLQLPHWRIVAAVGAACAAVVVVASMLLRDPDSSVATPDSQQTAALYDSPEFDHLLGRQPPPVELAVTLNEQMASVVEIETTNEKVRFYRIN